ncbi:hypothetical protein KQI41_10440 [Tissierella pigra]|uniref:Uncharacterized protein n=1 Tax=Tissierella pigra TaxID=2607614 RepID=A0A6N7XZS7_9FIRM|nr:hypothetical protein [Tissierella pigra]MBU5426827.1 hypothetical protein [Tissierella pigra]MSU01300.1 hypothetical protein [Tissierella pigra]
MYKEFDINMENTEKIKKLYKKRQLVFIGKVPFELNVVKVINNGKTTVDIYCELSTAVKVTNVAKQSIGSIYS